jgi:hypothetical protein
VNRTLTARQLVALASRATQPTLAPGQFGQGIADAATALAEILAGPPADLVGRLREFVHDAPKWDNNEYLDGWACIADDVHGVLDGDPEVIKMLRDSRPTASVEAGAGSATTSPGESE